MAVAACEPTGPTALITTSDGDEVRVQVEIADSSEERQRGLMHRTDLGPDQGMVFFFEEEAPRSFWMKNTPTSLDILFIASDGRIVGIRPRTVPYSLEPISVGIPSRVVLEVPAGFVERHGVATGDHVSYHNVDSPLAPATRVPLPTDAG